MLRFLFAIAIVLILFLSDSNHFYEKCVSFEGVQMEGFAAWMIDCLDNWAISFGGF
jgi:hypothetical protein